MSGIKSSNINPVKNYFDGVAKNVGTGPTPIEKELGNKVVNTAKEVGHNIADTVKEGLKTKEGKAIAVISLIAAPLAAPIVGAGLVAKGIADTISDHSKLHPGKINDKDINWALKLENKIKNENHQPTENEKEKYGQIYQKLQSGEVEQKGVKSTKIEHKNNKDANFDDGKVNDTEISWALNLEKKVKEGYTPNSLETGKYQQIAEKVSAGKVEDKNNQSNKDCMPVEHKP